MSSVDDRIVNMQFNNTQFTAGAAESQKALEGLEKTIANTGKGPGLQTMADGVDGVSKRFSAMEVTGVAALATIVSKATSAGLSLLKSFTLDPIMQGFGEYQTNLTSIQSIIANTGSTLGPVNEALNELNRYADLTVYNFSQMASAIGRFTAAGVDLNPAVTAIKGMANTAALTGASSEDLNRAMYQTSQALSAGVIRLMDWRSLENANMGSENMREALMATASTFKEQGPIMDAAIAKYGNFRASLADGWLTSEVFTKAMKVMGGTIDETTGKTVAYSKKQLISMGFTDEQAEKLNKLSQAAIDSATVIKTFPQLLQVVKESIGSIFAQLFSNVMGNFTQSKAIWTRVGNAVTGQIGSWGAALNKMTLEWAKAGGRNQVIRGFARTFKHLGRIIGAISDAFRDIFPPATAKDLSAISKGFNQFTKHLRVSKDTVESLRKIFGGIFAVLHIGISIVHGIFAAFSAFFGAIFSGSADARSGVLSLLGSLGELLKAFDKWLTSDGKLVDSMREVGTIAGAFIKPFLQGLGLIIKGFATLASGGGVSNFVEQMKSLGSISDQITSVMDSINNAFGGNQISTATGEMSSGFDRVKSSITSFLSDGPRISEFFNNLGQNAGTLAADGLKIAGSIVSGLASGIANAAPIVFSAMVSLASGIVEAFKNAMGIHSPAEVMVEPGIDILRGIGQGIAKGLLFVVKIIGGAAHLIKDAFIQLFGDMDAMDFAVLMNTIISGGFLLALTNLLNVFGNGKFASGFANTFDQLKNSLQAFQQSLKAQALLAIGAAVTLLVASLILLSLMSPKEIATGIGTLSVMIGILVAALSVMSKKTDGGLSLVAVAGSMNELATAIVILTGAIAILGNLKTETLIQGMTALAISLALMVGSARVMAGIGPSIMAAGAAMILVATAMNILSVAILAFGLIKPDTLWQGMTAMATGLALMVGALTALGSLGPQILAAAGAMLIIAVSMQALAVAVLMFGSMSLGELAKGFGAIAVGLLLIVPTLLTLAIMAPSVYVASQAVAIFAAAMILLAIAVEKFGGMSWEELGKGFAAVAGGLVLLLAAAFAAQFVAPGLVALGLALALIGAAVFLAGAGMLAFATALSILVVVGTAAIAVMVVAIEAFIALLPSIAMQMAASFVSFIETIAAAAPRIREAFNTIFENIIQGIIDLMPEIGKLVLALIKMVLQVIRGTATEWAETGRTILDAFLKAIMKEIPQLAEAALVMIEQFLGVIGDNIDRIIQAGTRVIVKFLKGIGDASTQIADQMGQTILAILEGWDAAIKKYARPIRNAGLQLMWDIIDAMTGGMASAITDAIGGAIKEGLSHIDLSDAVGGLVSSVTGGALGRTSAGPNSFKGLQALANQAVNTAFGLANANVPQDDPLIKKAQKQVIADEKKARALAAKAAAARAKADKLEKIANKKNATDKQRKAATKAAAEADKIESQLQAAQDQASRSQDALQSAIDFNQADLHGKGDIRSDQAAELAQRANDLLAKANAEAARARTMTGSAAKKMMEQAKRDAAEAKKLADQAKAIQAEANTFYTQEVNDRIAAMEKALADEAKQKAEDAAYEAADQAGKAKILQDRAAAADAEAAAAKQKAAQLVEEAKALAATDAVAAMKKLDEADTLTDQAKEAADRAEEARKQAEELLSQPGTSAGSSGGSTIRPSSTVLEDAAKAVDRYSQSLAQANELAGATSSVVQYTQNVYSPKPLDAATVYRQSRNLIAAQEIKMGGTARSQFPKTPPVQT